MRECDNCKQNPAICAEDPPLCRDCYDYYDAWLQAEYEHDLAMEMQMREYEEQWEEMYGQ